MSDDPADILAGIRVRERAVGGGVSSSSNIESASEFRSVKAGALAATQAYDRCAAKLREAIRAALTGAPAVPPGQQPVIGEGS